MNAIRHLADPVSAGPASPGRTLGVFLLLLLSVFMPAAARGDQVFSQPSNGTGTIYKSSWYAPDGLDGDEYAFDGFSVAANVAISEIRWRGGYGYNLPRANEGAVSGFTISIYRSIGGNSQPDLGTGGRLARYNVTGLAGETSAGTIGGVSMYDYHFTLPAPFQAVGGTVYWIQIEASQGLVPGSGWPPDWGLAAASGGNNSHFRGITGAPYAMISGDLAFSLFSAGGSTVNISATASPANAGVVAGAGAYPLNSTVTLDATANPGWGFVNWTEGGSPVSNSSHYVFTATASRTLVANFAQAFTITTAASPLAGGTTTGDGVYTSGTTVTVVATANHGFVFAGWSDGATTPTHSFPAAADLQLTAFFDTDPLSVAFSFDNLRQYAPLPIDDTVNGLTASLSATGQGYSIQAVGTVGIAPPGFSGLCVFPSSVFASDLIIDFSETLVDFSILYSPQELGCDDSATMRVTVYMNGTFVATNTTTAPVPGTWPSATLAIAAPAGFNRAVVHYDHRPPTCQDYGVIFLADNMLVTRACVAPAVSFGPLPESVCPAGTATFSISASGAGPLGYQWRKDTLPIDPVVNPSAAGATLTLFNVQPGDAGSYDCVVTGSCGTVTSPAAALTVGGSGCCPADFNQDGILNADDLADFITGYFNTPSDPRADFNGDGVINADDLGDFITAYFNGC